jgi:Na+-transporting NADH:ubiquinone oxidoreductase subunit A
MQITITRGRNLALAGTPVQTLNPGPAIETVALQGEDFPGLRPSFEVEIGERVAAGQPLFVDRKRPEIVFTSPVAGVVEEIHRGPRRTLGLVVIRADGDEAVKFDVPPDLDGENVRALLLRSGLWPAFRTRPFERIPDPAAAPAALFVTAMDTAPLAADASVVLAESKDVFAAGLAAVGHLTDGPVIVCQAPGPPLTAEQGKVRIVHFAGPHPAGLPGTHIHRLMPVGRDRTVWHIGYQDVVAIGRLTDTGRLSAERVVALGGPAMRDPRLVTAQLGASLSDLTEDGLAAAATLISGSVLAGRPAHYLGRYDSQVTALSPPRPSPMRNLGRWLSTALGESGRNPIIPVAAYDRVMALDILAVPLIRALAVGDADTAERLGGLELAEEDVALLSHVCPAGIDYGPLLRGVLDEIAEEV